VQHTHTSRTDISPFIHTNTVGSITATYIEESERQGALTLKLASHESRRCPQHYSSAGFWIEKGNCGHRPRGTTSWHTPTTDGICTLNSKHKFAPTYAHTMPTN